MTRVLETVLTARNLLSPELAKAGRDVVAFNSTVAGANAKASTSATSAAAVQDRAADKIAASNVKASTSASVSAQTQARAHAKAAESATLSARVQETANRSLAASNGLLGTSLTPLTAGLGATGLALAYAGYRGMEFGSAMSQVQAASQETGATLNQLRDAAVDAGAKTQYSAVEAAQGITEMSKAGVQAKDILGGGLTGALNLAAAGQISVAEAAETGATALSVFNLNGNQMAHVADLLAAGAGKAQGSVGDLSAALNQSALVANQTGLSIESTAGALAMFASNGLVGSDAGTSFKAMLQALTPNSVAASKAMDAIGFSAYDAQGQFVGMESVAAQLKTGLAGLTEETRNTTLETIFGSDAVRAASVLYSEGAAGVSEWTGKVNDAGFAARQAADLNDNLRGDLEKLGGAFDSVMTTIGGGAQGPLRELVQMFTGLVGAVGWTVDTFSSLPGPVQAAAVALGLLYLTNGPLSGFLSKLGSGISNVASKASGAVTSVSGFRGALSGIAGAISPASVAISGAVLLIPSFIEGIRSMTGASEQGRVAQEGFAEALRATGGIIDETSRASARRALIDADIVDVLHRAGVSSRDAIDGLLGQADAQDRVNAALQRYITANPGGVHNAEAEGARQARNDYQGLADTLGITREEAEFFGKAATGAAEASAAATPAIAGMGAAAGLTQDQVSELGQSLADFVEPLGAYTGLLDEKKEADRKAAEATAAATESSKDSWEDYVTDVTVSFEEYKTRLEEQVTAQANWQTNMLELAGRVSQGTLDELARMGPEGAPLVADLVNRSDAELDHMDDLFAARSQEATDAWGAKLSAAAPVLAAIGRVAGKGVVDELAAKLQAGTATVEGIAAQYGVKLAGGINPVLQALGKRPIAGLNGRRGGLLEADGGVVDYYANGGVENHTAQIAPAGAWRVWAEPETGGEGYVPLAPSKRDQSLPIWREIGRRLNAPEAQYFAFGGISDVPRPSSTAPYRAPISTAGDAVMGREYDEVTAWLRANQEPLFTGGGTATASSSALVKFGVMLQKMGARVSEHPAFGGVTMGAHVPGSKHYSGRAIDVNTRAGTSSLEQRELTPMMAMARAAGFQVIFMSEGHYNHGHVASYKAGTPYVPADGLAYLHQGERVVPREQNVAPAAMPGYGGAGGRGGGPAIDYDRLATAISKVAGTHIEVDATGYNADYIARKVDQKLTEREWLSSP